MIFLEKFSIYSFLVCLMTDQVYRVNFTPLFVFLCPSCSLAGPYYLPLSALALINIGKLLHLPVSTLLNLF